MLLPMGVNGWIINEFEFLEATTFVTWLFSLIHSDLMAKQESIPIIMKQADTRQLQLAKRTTELAPVLGQQHRYCLCWLFIILVTQPKLEKMSVMIETIGNDICCDIGEAKKKEWSWVAGCFYMMVEKVMQEYM